MTTIKKPIIGIAYSDSAQRDNEMRIRTYVSRKYYHAIQRAGGIAILLPAPYGDPALTEFEKECLNTEHATNYLNLVDGIVFAGGEDVAPRYQNEEPIPELDMVNPFRDAYEITLAKLAFKEKKSMLGICRGIQLMAIAFGGKVHQDISGIEKVQHRQKSPRWYPSHKITINKGSLLEKAVQAPSHEIYVNSFHHQAIKTLPEGFIASGKAHDGIIEAMEYSANKFVCLGVQWHPEETYDSDSHSKGIFEWFVKNCLL
jgi:putative glutamine amidotransferase